eukprot:gnl/MRDRNA2_/MRDRNA2_72235_c0_seq1.p1 gnl/MRDRNA2_/MRDRNA2_72235_c0~~gnl/MRDRNA2_/MRDRNA2_72235_c0_seq1.p1  ORF type:complete len:305 (+),score=44.31 gnl/MRDRNA2_/MRDRNA2_72235_c0_seq1:223-1137(+)
MIILRIVLNISVLWMGNLPLVECVCQVAWGRGSIADIDLSNAEILQRECGVHIDSTEADSQTHLHLVYYRLVVAVFEVAGITLLFTGTLHCIVRAVLVPGPSRWQSIGRIFWIYVYEMEVFSALRMLNDVHPSMLVVRFLEDTLAPSWGQFCCLSTLFILKSLFCLAAGISAFICKVATASSIIFDRNQSEMYLCLYMLGFLNQVMGIIHVKRLLKERVLRVFSGGTDAIITLREEEVLEYYLAKLTETIWYTWGSWKSTILLLTLDDDDFQSLLLEEQDWIKDDEEKQIEALNLQEAESDDDE